MTGDQQIKIVIDHSLTQSVCNYSVGFLRFERDGKMERAMPAGTGTFVKRGKVYGILTAGHVLHRMGENEIVGLVRFPGVQPALQNFRLDLNRTDRIVTWNGNECDAPDIAFLKIPEVDGRNLEAAGAVYYNLALPRVFGVKKREHRMSKCHAVVGVVGEWTEMGPAQFAKGLKVDVGGLFGAVKTLREFTEKETDLLEAEIDHAGSPRAPKSYGGVSGGALWELHVELDTQLKPVEVNKRLIGVAFRQTLNHRLVICNGMPSIEQVTEEIATKWPNENSGS